MPYLTKFLAIFLCSLMSNDGDFVRAAANRPVIKSLEYCGPPDKTFKWQFSPWPPVIGKRLNVTIRFTPAENIFISSAQIDVWTEPDGQLLYERYSEKTRGVLIPSGFSANQTYVITRTVVVPDVPRFFEAGSYKVRAELYNQDQDMWFCAQMEGSLIPDQPAKQTSLRSRMSSFFSRKFYS